MTLPNAALRSVNLFPLIQPLPTFAHRLYDEHVLCLAMRDAAVWKHAVVDRSYRAERPPNTRIGPEASPSIPPLWAAQRQPHTTLLSGGYHPETE